MIKHKTIKFETSLFFGAVQMHWERPEKLPMYFISSRNYELEFAVIQPGYLLINADEAREKS